MPVNSRYHSPAATPFSGIESPSGQYPSIAPQT